MRREEAYLADIVEAARMIESFLEGVGREGFVGSELIRSAVVAKLTIIGEAVSRLPQDLKDRHPSIEWRKISAFRNLLMHAYFVLDWDIVWVTASIEAPELGRAIAVILASEFPASTPLESD
jgi:uncharacterized protein with HEPN domain